MNFRITSFHAVLPSLFPSSLRGGGYDVQRYALVYAQSGILKVSAWAELGYRNTALICYELLLCIIKPMPGKMRAFRMNCYDCSPLDSTSLSEGREGDTRTETQGDDGRDG